MTNDSLPEGTLVFTLQDNDVLFGRGNGVNYRPGNLHLRNLAHARSLQFVDANKTGKQKIIQEILDQVAAANGRFVRKVENVWEIVDRKTVVSKIKQVLRDRALLIRANSNNVEEEKPRTAPCYERHPSPTQGRRPGPVRESSETPAPVVVPAQRLQQIHPQGTVFDELAESGRRKRQTPGARLARRTEHDPPSQYDQMLQEFQDRAGSASVGMATRRRRDTSQVEMEKPPPNVEALLQQQAARPSTIQTALLVNELAVRQRQTEELVALLQRGPTDTAWTASRNLFRRDKKPGRGNLV